MTWGLYMRTDRIRHFLRTNTPASTAGRSKQKGGEKRIRQWSDKFPRLTGRSRDASPTLAEEEKSSSLPRRWRPRMEIRLQTIALSKVVEENRR